MATVAILGASGYSGQETLDRVLRHPELEVVALGSDSLAGEPAAALDVRLNGSLPRFVGERRRRSPPAPTSSSPASATTRRAARAAGRQRRRRPLRRAPAAGRRALSGLVRVRAPAAGAIWRVELRGARALPAERAADRQPRLLRDRGDPRARADRRTRSSPASVVVDAKSGVSGAGRELKQSSHAGFVLENVSPYKVGAHQHAPEIAQALGFPVCFVPHLLPVRRGLLATCYVQPTADDLRALLEEAYADEPRRATCCPRASCPSSRACSTRTARRSASSRTARRATPIVICALDNLGKGAAGQALQNANLALGLEQTLGLRLDWSARMSVTAAKGFVAGGVALRHPQERPARRRASCARSFPRPARRCSRPTASSRRRSSSRASISSSRSRRRSSSNSGVANAATGEQGVADARATAVETARLLGLEPEEVIVLSTGVIGAPLPMEKLLNGVREGSAAHVAHRRRDVGRGDHDYRHAAEGGASAHGDGLHGRRHGEGLGDDPSQHGDDARRDHDRLSARAGRGDRVPAARRRCELQRDLGRRRVLDERRGRPARERRERRRAHPASDEEFALCIRKVCGELAQQIVADGEGMTVLAEIAVRGATDEAEARAIAERVATSPLVKTALHGHDANWGRIAAAAGSAKFNGGYAQLDPDKLSITIDAVQVLLDGTPTGDEPVLANGHCSIELDLALGDGAANYLTTDLSYDYVRINADYRT